MVCTSSFSEMVLPTELSISSRSAACLIAASFSSCIEISRAILEAPTMILFMSFIGEMVSDIGICLPDFATLIVSK